MAAMDVTAISPEPPAGGQSVAVDYSSVYGDDTHTVSGDIVSVTSTPDGWYAKVAGYGSGYYKLVVKSGAAYVEKRDVDGQYKRIGFATVDGGGD